MWQAIAPWLAQGGILSVLAWAGIKLHSDAVAAERRRADDWRTAWEAERARADVREEQLSVVLGRAREPTA